jgi:hypothetical protein
MTYRAPSFVYILALPSCEVHLLHPDSERFSSKSARQVCSAIGNSPGRRHHIQTHPTPAHHPAIPVQVVRKTSIVSHRQLLCSRLLKLSPPHSLFPYGSASSGCYTMSRSPAPTDALLRRSRQIVSVSEPVCLPACHLVARHHPASRIDRRVVGRRISRPTPASHARHRRIRRRQNPPQQIVRRNVDRSVLILPGPGSRNLGSR